MNSFKNCNCLGCCSTDEILDMINKGPYASDIQVKEEMAHYRSGDYIPYLCRKPNHSVTVVQYDAERVKFRNSWGRFWGEEGYGFILKDAGTSKGGLKACGLLTYGYQPNDIEKVDN